MKKLNKEYRDSTKKNHPAGKYWLSRTIRERYGGK